MAWTSLTATLDGPITIGYGQGVIDNFTAMASGSAGAPKIQNAALAGYPWTSAAYATGSVGAAAIATGAVGQAEIAASAVGQSEIKSASGTTSTTTSINYILPGGAYGFMPRLTHSSAVGSDAAWQAVSYAAYGGGSGSYLTQVVLEQRLSGTAYMQQHYIAASPPYNLGDGDISRFVFAVVDKNTGAVESVYSASEAPWHYNGPTDIRGKAVKDAHGRMMKARPRKIMADIPYTLKEAILDPAKFEAYSAAFKSADILDEEITQELKNRDMPLIPHPFIGNDMAGKTVIMLDPVCDTLCKISELIEEHDEFNFNELLHDGRFVIDNTALNRSTPPGVTAHSFRLK